MSDVQHSVGPLHVSRADPTPRRKYQHRLKSCREYRTSALATCLLTHTKCIRQQEDVCKQDGGIIAFWTRATHCKADGSSCQGIGSQASGKDLICDQNRLHKPEVRDTDAPFYVLTLRAIGLPAESPVVCKLAHIGSRSHGARSRMPSRVRPSLHCGPRGVLEDHQTWLHRIKAVDIVSDKTLVISLGVLTM